MMNTDMPLLSGRRSRAALPLALLLIAFSAGCKKKAPVPPPPPPPAATAAPAPAPAPGRPTVAEFSVEPSTVERGQSAIVRWSVSSATDVSIDNGIGAVQVSGNRRVIPAETTTYTLTANGPGGMITATATVSVTGPAAPPASNTNTSSRGTIESRVQADLRDALFDYDSNNIRDDARAALTSNADALKRIFADFPSAVVNVEGHCDERGSAEYNLGLGDRRASAARDYLTQLGVPADRLKTISYGKERPACTEASEGCYQQNRRAHFSVGQ